MFDNIHKFESAQYSILYSDLTRKGYGFETGMLYLGSFLFIQQLKFCVMRCKGER